ncbi:hypothetical protein MtrunA17_Chr2g0304661 [Medicago truncatula]|uniref:Uncharacterized protein n=1 Tax=Medicago truncatula TaxID=3880 RepID=A0A396J712_MEDTR|nr:hypothetical protein MtrunA17_Chr2g0304661 [Medicago truncatula]
MQSTLVEIMGESFPRNLIYNSLPWTTRPTHLSLLSIYIPSFSLLNLSRYHAFLFSHTLNSVL